MPEKSIKKRNWAAVLYPESLPSDWRDTLIATGIPFAVSPLHDQDINPDGTAKKPHYHIILSYPGPTTFSCVDELIRGTLGQPMPMYLESVKGAYRYFTHKDNPDKYQYNESGICCFNGFDPSDYCAPSASESLAYKKKIQQLIIELGIYEYAELMDYLLVNDLTEEYFIASSNTIFFNNYICSRRNAATKASREDARH